MKKLILFGDSLFAQADKHRILLFEEALKDYDIYNCAVGGWDTNDCVKKSPYISQLKPEVVVISLGTNDAAPWKQVPIEKFIENIPEIFKTFSNSKIVYFLPTPVDEAKTKSVGKGLLNEHIKPYHDAAKNVCEEQGIAYINSFAVFKSMIDAGQEYHNEDGIHFENIAYEIIAKELTNLV